MSSKISLSFLGLLLSVAALHAQGWTPVAPVANDFISNHSYGFALDSMGYLVAGESPSGFTNSFYQYNPTTDTWSEMENFPGPARGYTIGDDWNGKAWMGFGISTEGFLNDLWVFDPDSMTWTERASCPCEGRAHPAMVAEGDKVFMGLGSGAGGDLDDWWEYDMLTDEWSQKPDFPGTERHHPFQFGIDGSIYVGFGHNGPNIYNEWYRYDPTTEVWTEMATLPAEGRVAGTQFAHNGMGYALSGDGESHSSMETGEFWQYDPASNEWNAWPAHPGMSRWAPASFVIADEVYLINGMSMDPGSFDYMSTNWKFSLVPSLSNDLGISAYLGPTEVCGENASPMVVQLTNWGADTIFAGDAQALTVEMIMDGEVVLASDWSGSLSTYQSAEFNLGMYVFAGESTIEFSLGYEDGNEMNNVLQAEVNEVDQGTTQWLVTLQTDSWGGETGWVLIDAEGNVVDEANPGTYDNEGLYQFNLSLPGLGCYTFILTDTYGDGLNGSAWGGVDGYCTIESLGESGDPINVIFEYDGSFSFESLEHLVDVNTLVSTFEEIRDFEGKVYPNPFNEWVSLEGFQSGAYWQISDVRGRICSNGYVPSDAIWRVHTANCMAGPFLLTVVEDDAVCVFRLLKQ